MMDRDQIIFIASLTVFAVGVSAFVLWGPKISSSKRRRGSLIGLQNLGYTCFLNTLIQALASCHFFVEWLEHCSGQGQVTDSLLRLLKILNNHEDSVKDINDPYSPNEVIDALKHHGWAISPGEQDAHELFHLFILTLEEEAQRNSSSLTDCLSSSEETNEKTDNLLTDGLSQGDAESKPITNGDIFNGPTPQRSDHCYMEGSDHGEPGAVKKLPSCDNNRNLRSSPFCGLLTSHLGCTKCGFKSVKYDKFDSLSLHLPTVGNNAVGRSTLTQLLDKFVRTELISGVACDGCNSQQDDSKETVTSTSVKTLSIGKLPQCLCLHIVRTAMGPNSTPFKRQDYVEFPEYLVMDPYTRNSMMKNLKFQEEMGIMEPETQLLHTNSAVKSGPCNHLYRIKAVVVHKGSVDSGHFVTYRRGPIGSQTRHRCSLSSRWYYTSDADVRESTLCEALQATAYMLYYEKCAST